MAQIMIDLPDTVSDQSEESGISRAQLNRIVSRLSEIYLYQHQQSTKKQSSESPKDLPRQPRKAGSGKHLNIVMADDFDEPLEDFAEYMW